MTTLAWGSALVGIIILAFLISWALLRTLRPPSSESIELGFVTHILKVGNWNFHYVDEGQGELVVLLHGIGANILCWRTLWPILSQKMRVIALDLPGFGRSSKLQELYGLDEQISRIKDFLDRLGVKQAHFIGNSMGANISLWFAAHYPERTSSVTVIAPATSVKLVPRLLPNLSRVAGPLSLLLSKPAITWAHRRTVSQKNLVDGQRVSETWRTYGRDGDAVRSFFLAMQTIRDPRILDTVSRIQDTVLILWGKGDKLVPWTVVEQLQSSLKKCRVKIHENGGHHLQEDDPQWVAEQFFSVFHPSNHKG
jgi:abhydrolase domain-containing protein 6